MGFLPAAKVKEALGFSRNRLYLTQKPFCKHIADIFRGPADQFRSAGGYWGMVTPLSPKYFI